METSAEIEKIIGAVKARVAAEYLKSRLNHFKENGGRMPARQMSIFNKEKGRKRK